MPAVPSSYCKRTTIPVETTESEKSTDAPEIDKELEEAKHSIKRNIILKKLMKMKKMMNRSGNKRNTSLYSFSYIFE